METFQERMVNEFKELSDRVVKLEKLYPEQSTVLQA